MLLCKQNSLNQKVSGGLDAPVRFPVHGEIKLEIKLEIKPRLEMSRTAKLLKHLVKKMSDAVQKKEE